MDKFFNIKTTAIKQRHWPTNCGEQRAKFVRAGEIPQPEYSRPEVAANLTEAMHESPALQNR